MPAKGPFALGCELCLGLSELGSIAPFDRWWATSGLPYEQTLPGRPGTSENSSASFDYLVRQKERSFTLLLVHSVIPKAIELFLDYPADILPA